MPTFYKLYIDDTLSTMPDDQATSSFLSTLNEIHHSISFTMELEKNGKLPFLGMEIIRNMRLQVASQAVRGPITKINQSKCSVAGPIYSKYWTGHCPK